MMNWYGTGMSGWGYALMILNTVLFWALIIGGTVLLVRYLSRAGTHNADSTIPSQTPEQILAERFARGDIDEEEYQRRLDILRRTPTA
jgi:putative membrane protein